MKDWITTTEDVPETDQVYQMTDEGAGWSDPEEIATETPLCDQNPYESLIKADEQLRVVWRDLSMAEAIFAEISTWEGGYWAATEFFESRHMRSTVALIQMMIGRMLRENGAGKGYVTEMVNDQD